MMGFVPTAQAEKVWHNEYSCVDSEHPRGYDCSGGTGWKCVWDHDGTYGSADGGAHEIWYHFYVCTPTSTGGGGGGTGGGGGGGGTRPPVSSEHGFYLGYEDNQGMNGPVHDEWTSETETMHEFAISPIEPVRDGYTFLGWADSSTATKPKYKYNGTKDGLYDSIIVNADVAKYIYAVWQKTVNTPPTITGATDKTIHVGEFFDELEGVSASDKEDGDLTDVIYVDEETVDNTKPGKYTLTYSVTDSGGLTTTVNRVITVQADMLKAMPSTGIPAVGLLPVIGIGLFGLGVMIKRKRTS